MIEQLPNARFHVRSIPASLVDRFWQYAEPYIKRALDHTSGEFLPADIRRFCRDDIIQLWLVSEGDRIIGAVTTEIVLYPNCKRCRVVTLAGTKAPEWAPLLDTILEDWARSEQCDGMEAFVRKGYVPILVKRGYQPKYSMVVKELG